MAAGAVGSELGLRLAGLGREGEEPGPAWAASTRAMAAVSGGNGGGRRDWRGRTRRW
jgi:hypothetical protein